MPELNLPPMTPMPELPAAYQGMALQAERDVLGYLMLIGHLQDSELNPSWLSTLQHYRIFEAMCLLEHKSLPIDVVTLYEELQSVGHLDCIGGLEFLGKLAAEAPYNASWLVTPILRDLALMRYGTAREKGDQVVIRLSVAIEQGLLHGRAWRASPADLGFKNKPDLTGLAPGEADWVCYGFLAPAH